MLRLLLSKIKVKLGIIGLRIVRFLEEWAACKYTFLLQEKPANRIGFLNSPYKEN
jgi:hypothetical protein